MARVSWPIRLFRQLNSTILNVVTRFDLIVSVISYGAVFRVQRSMNVVSFWGGTWGGLLGQGLRWRLN